MMISDWVPGDLLGMSIPAHADALLEGGEAFLTDAFRATGAIAPDNAVCRIVRADRLSIGGTGHKLFLSLEYEQPSPELHNRLFVKFSRNFEDPILDYSRHDLEAEIRLAVLSGMPGFPVSVAPHLFGDFHHESGTGLLITAWIPFGEGALEPHYPKCLDYKMPDRLGHYEALVTAVARLAGMQKGRRLPDADRHFPLDRNRLLTNDLIPYDADRLGRRVGWLAQFAAEYPQLLPPNIRSPDFMQRLALEAPRLLERQQAIRHFLHASDDFIALCHWNANIDNAWFWRDAGGKVQCGLLDWGRVGIMHVGMALWGCLSGAETDILDGHLDDLMKLFVAEYSAAGGPCLDAHELTRQFVVSSALMGMAYQLDTPRRIQTELPDLASTATRFDPAFEANETLRVKLHMMTSFLHLWERRNPAAFLDNPPAISTAG